MNIGVMLSGSGVYDGSEIQEAVFTLLAIDELGAKAHCFAPNVNQHHVVNHITGEATEEKRNVLQEAARIARGKIEDIANVNVNDYEGIVIPGGFGAAKNLTTWALNGPEGTIHEDVKRIILNAIKSGKPIVALCMGPTVVAKALENSNISSIMTVGSTSESSPYDIAAISEGMRSVGVDAQYKTVREIAVDEKNRIITAPCYMMDASVSEIRNNIKEAIEKLVEMIKSN